MPSDFNFFGLVAEEILELRHKLTVNVDVLTLRKYRTPTVDQLSLRLSPHKLLQLNHSEYPLFVQKCQAILTNVLVL